MAETSAQTETGSGTGQRLRQLASHSFVYGLGGIASKLVAIFLLPIYTQHVSQEEFGAAELVIVTFTAVAIFLRFGLTNAMFRFVLQRPDQEDRRSVIQTAFTSVLVMSTVGLALGLALSDPFAELLQVSRTLVVIGLFGLWVNMNYDLLAALFRVEQRPYTFVSYSLVNVALTVILSIIFVIPLDLGAEGILLGTVAGSFIVYGPMVFSRRDVVGARLFDRDLLRRMLHYSSPLMPAGLMLWALNLADRFQVQRLASPEELGSYSAAAKISLGIMLLVAAFQTAWAPFAHSIVDDGEARRAYRTAFSYWAIVICWGLVAIALLTPPYVEITMPSQWWESADVVPLLMAGGVLYGAYMIVRIGVNRSGRTRLTPAVTGVAAAVNIGLNFVFIPWLGIVGAGISTLIGFSVLVLLGWMNAQRGFPVTYDWMRIFRVAFVAAVFVAASVWLIPPKDWDGILIRVALIPLFPLALLLVGAVKPGERQRMREFFAQAGRRGRRRRVVSSELGEEQAEKAESVRL